MAATNSHQQQGAHLHPQQQIHHRAALPPAAKELLAGFAAGAANVTSGYPFDTVKVRLQSAAPGQYRGSVHCLRTIVRHEGIRRGLFRGLSLPLVGGSAETGVNYLVYSRVLDALRPADGSAVPLTSVAAAGAVAGVTLSGILGPTELVKCRMQQAGSGALYPGGPLQCLREIVATEGCLRGLTRGLGATLARELPGNAIFFAAYEGLRRAVLGTQRSTSGAHGHGPAAEDWSAPSLPLLADFTAQADSQRGADTLVREGARRCDAAAVADSSPHQQHWMTEAATAVFCGGAAGMVMWAVVLPIDVAKTRLQTARPGSPWDVSLRKHWAMLWREGGVKSLYAGLTPTLIRAFPANACQWLAWELVMRGMLQDDDARAR